MPTPTHEAPPAAAALVLAAGSSSRLGQPKQLLPYEGETLLHRAVRTAAAAGCSPIVVVTGALDNVLRGAVADLPCRVVHNPDWASGMGSSVRAGLAPLLPGPDAAGSAPAGLAAVLLMLCDQPLLTAEHLSRLISVQRQTGRAAVATTYAGIVGVPAIFGPALFERLRSLDGAGGAQRLLRSLPTADVDTLDFPAAALDVDTPAQYAQLLATAKRSP